MTHNNQETQLLENIKTIELGFENGLLITVDADDITDIKLKGISEPVWLQEYNETNETDIQSYEVQHVTLTLKPSANTHAIITSDPETLEDGETLFSRLSDTDGFTDLVDIELCYADNKESALLYLPFVAGDSLCVINLCQIEEQTDDDAFTLSISQHNTHRHSRVDNKPYVNKNLDGVPFDELLNELYAFEARCQNIHTSIDHREPQAQRQTLDLKRAIHVLRKTVEKQGIA